MGGELVTGSSPFGEHSTTNEHIVQSYTDLFYSHFPFYLAIGMSYEQFWNDDCLLVKYYRKAHELKRQERNQELWIQGAYVYEAILDIAPVLHAFAKKGAKPQPYVEEPFPLTQEEVRQREEREALKKYQKAKEKLSSWAHEVNRKKR